LKVDQSSVLQQALRPEHILTGLTQSYYSSFPYQNDISYENIRFLVDILHPTSLQADSVQITTTSLPPIPPLSTKTVQTPQFTGKPADLSLLHDEYYDFEIKWKKPESLAEQTGYGAGYQGILDENKLANLFPIH
jgi:hypothetical protein